MPEQEQQPEPAPENKKGEKPFDPDATDEFEPLIEDPVDILKRGREERDRETDPQKRHEIEEETKRQIVDNAKRRKERDEAKEKKPQT